MNIQHRRSSGTFVMAIANVLHNRMAVRLTMMESSTTISQIRIDNWHQLTNTTRSPTTQETCSIPPPIPLPGHFNMGNVIQFVQDAPHFLALYRKWNELCCPLIGFYARLVVHLSTKLVPLPGERGAWGVAAAVLQLSGAAWLAPWFRQHVFSYLSWAWFGLFLVEGLVHSPHSGWEILRPDLCGFSVRAIHATNLNKTPT